MNFPFETKRTFINSSNRTTYLCTEKVFVFIFDNPIYKYPPLFTGFNILAVFLFLTFPKSKLEILYCHLNNLTSLPSDMSQLQHLYCWNNELTVLPEFPIGQLQEINCLNNPIKYIPPHIQRIHYKAW